MLILVNLASAHERRDVMTAQLAATGLPYERIGVDMRLRSGEEIAAWTAAHFPSFRFDLDTLSGAEIGCWVSHLSAWQRLLAQDRDPACTVIEDDLVLRPDFADAVAALASQSGFDVVYLGTSSKNLSTRKQTRIGRFVACEPIGAVYNTWGYSITRRYVKQLFGRKRVHLDMPIDHFVGGAGAPDRPRIAVLRPAVIEEHPTLGVASQIGPHTRRLDRWRIVESTRRRLLASRVGALYYSLYRWL
jgi:GR25 family glycosyltransferase involved in LPS biosynthesis